MCVCVNVQFQIFLIFDFDFFHLILLNSSISSVFRNSWVCLTCCYVVLCLWLGFRPGARWSLPGQCQPLLRPHPQRDGAELQALRGQHGRPTARPRPMPGRQHLGVVRGIGHLHGLPGHSHLLHEPVGAGKRQQCLRQGLWLALLHLVVSGK